MKGRTIDGRLALVAWRPDGVIAVDIGDSMIVLCNVVEGIKTKSIDRLLLNRFGPWLEFDDVKPSDAVREKVAKMIDASSRQIHVVNPSVIGLSDLDRAASMELIDTSYTRQDFDNMLQTANFDSAQELPATGANFEQDADFMTHCTTNIVPMMQQNGLHVANAAGFCSMLHLQRTGLMPSLSQQTAPSPSTVPLFDPNAAASNQPAVQASAPAIAPPPDIPNVASPAQTPPAPVPLVVAATPMTQEHLTPAAPAAPHVPAEAAPPPHQVAPHTAPHVPTPPMTAQAPGAPAPPHPGQVPGHQGPEKQQMPAQQTAPPASATPPIPPAGAPAVVDDTAVSVPHPPPVPVTANPATAIGKPFKRPQDASKVIGKPAASATND